MSQSVTAEAGSAAARLDEARGARPDAGALSIALMRAAAGQEIERDWRSLLQTSLDDSPFLSPDFVLPAASHAADGQEPDLVAVWENGAESRRLVGLFVIKGGAAQAGEIRLRPRQAAFWRHPLQPFAAPLLAGPPERALRIVQAFLGWLEARAGLSTFEAGALPEGSAVGRAFQEAALRRGLPIARRQGADLTRGLDFKPQGLGGMVDAVSVATEPGALPAALERLLLLDGEQSAHRAIVLGDPGLPALLRASVRSFGRSGRAAIALAEEAQTGALILAGRDKAYLWRLFGARSGDPAVEAALAVAAERRLGLPIAAASTAKLCGAGTDAIPTETLTIGLAPGSASMMGRIRLRIGSGLFGLG